MAINFPTPTTIGETYIYEDTTYVWSGVKWTIDATVLPPYPINGIFWENDKTIISNYTITTGKNAFTAGPITIANNVVVTVGDGDTWTIV